VDVNPTLLLAAYSASGVTSITINITLAQLFSPAQFLSGGSSRGCWLWQAIL